MAELDHAGGDDFGHRGAGGFEVVAGVKVALLGRQQFADGAGHREAVVGVDVDLADAVLDAFLDVFDGDAVGLGHFAAVLVDQVDQFFRDRRAAVHDHVAVRHAAVDLGDHVHAQDLAGGLLFELVGAVARADRDGERVAAGLLDKVAGFGRVGEVVLGFLFGEAGALAVLDAAEAAELGFDRHAARVRELDDLFGHVDVVVPAGRRLAVLFEAAVHHHGREAHLDSANAGRRRVAVVLVHRDRDVRVELGRRDHQVAQVVVVRVRTRAARGLDDHRRIGLGSGHHDRLDLLHVVDVESADAVAVFGGVVEQNAHRDEGHVAI